MVSRIVNRILKYLSTSVSEFNKHTSRTLIFLDIEVNVLNLSSAYNKSCAQIIKFGTLERKRNHKTFKIRSKTRQQFKCVGHAVQCIRLVGFVRFLFFILKHYSTSLFHFFISFFYMFYININKKYLLIFLVLITLSHSKLKFQQFNKTVILQQFSGTKYFELIYLVQTIKLAKIRYLRRHLIRFNRF